MHLISRLLHWTTLPAGRRLMAVLGAQVVAVLPWVRERAARGTRVLARLLIAASAGAAGGYLRQLAWWLARGAGMTRR
ncbi:hypothetical protein [Stenotrophomonas maltophilia]|uniref:hypothetical protein n=1 Tax=Stenotrophomonas maltophilia TaxID=40324 RepID=UPI0013DA68D7|nr:hypothetical protein [Stenotrophomonas maltophilia]